MAEKTRTREFFDDNPEVISDVSKRIAALRQEFTDIVDEQGNFRTFPDNAVDGRMRMRMAAHDDPRTLPTSMLRSLHATLTADDEMLRQRRERLVAYRDAMLAIINDISRLIDEAEEAQRADASETS